MTLDHLKTPEVPRRGLRRRRPSLVNLLEQHSEALALGVVAPPEDDSLAVADDDRKGLNALFQLVGSGAEHLRMAHVEGFLEQLGVFMDAAKVRDLFNLHELRLSPAEAEALEAAGAKAPGEGVMVVGGFKQLLHMIVNSGDGGGDGLLGLGDASKPNHAMKADDVKKLRRLFNSVDIDDDQELNASEIVLVFQKWGLDNILESEILELISRFDVDKSGTLDFDEFLALATAATALTAGEEEDMEMVIKTHFVREHAKVRALAVRQRLSVDAATLQFFKRGDARDNTVGAAGRVASNVLHKLGGGKDAQRKAYEHVLQRLTGELDDKLLEAAENGRVEELGLMLARGANANATRMDPPRESALGLALQCRQVKAATALLDAGADAGLKDDAGTGTILAATLSGCLSKSKHVLQLLISRGAKVNDQDELGQCALLAAVQRGKVVEVDALLSFGAHANLADAEGSTPLMKAAQAGEKAICARLIEGDADLNVLDDANRTARDRAALCGVDVVEELLAKHGGLSGDQVLEATSPRERERLVANAGRVKRTSRTGRLRSLSDSKMERAHRSSRHSFSKSLGSPASSPTGADATEFVVSNALKIFADDGPATPRSPRSLLEPLSA